MKVAVKPHQRPISRHQKREPPGRRAIAAAARKLFRVRGYARTTIEAIAQEAGHAVPTVYFHFGTKAAIVAYLIDQMEAKDIVQVFQKLLQEGDPIPMLQRTAHIRRMSCERWCDV